MKFTVMAASAALAACLVAPLAHGQTKMVLINMNEPQVGLNDPAPVPRSGGNPGATLGQQRLIVYQYALDIWAALLRTPVPIRVEAEFGPMICDSGGVVLGGASPSAHISADRVVPGGSTDYFYVWPMAEAIAGKELVPISDPPRPQRVNHVYTIFSSALDEPGCQAFGAAGWFYGLRGNRPDNSMWRSNFLNVVMHELAHGWGIFPGAGLVFFDFPYKFETPYGKLSWSNAYSSTINEIPDLGNMIKAMASEGDVAWLGEANELTQLLAEERSKLVVGPGEGVLYDYVPSDLGDVNLQHMVGQIELAQDVVAAGGVDSHTGCNGIDGQPAMANAAAVVGKIMLAYRGGCSNAKKAMNAQRLGAIGIILANTRDDAPMVVIPNAQSANLTIPVITVNREVGVALRVNAPLAVQGVRKVPGLFGTDAKGRLRLYTTLKPYSSGTSYSHVDLDMRPSPLMSPFEMSTVNASVNIDVTLEMLEDMGWPTNRNGTAKLGNCETGIPLYKDGFIPGANLIAHNNMCKATSAGSRSQQLRCMNEQINWLHGQTLLSSLEVAKARQCVAML